MQLVLAQENHLPLLLAMSYEAFQSDFLLFGMKEYPPHYDSFSWHKTMMEKKHLFVLLDDECPVGGALLFTDSQNRELLHIGRIFIHPNHFRKGYGTALMQLIEEMYPHIRIWQLDTPLNNSRTNEFYQKLGYFEIRRDDQFIVYQKTNKVLP